MNEDQGFVLSPRAKMIIFSLSCLLSVAAWGVFNVWLMPAAFKPDDFSDAVNLTISNSLEKDSIAMMQKGAVYTSEQLDNFDIFVIDDTQGSATQLLITKYEPSVPYDREGYRTYTGGYQFNPNR